MVRPLLLLTTAAIAVLGETEMSTCGASFTTDGKCQNETSALLQLASVPEAVSFQKVLGSSSDNGLGPVGSDGPKHLQLFDMKGATVTSMNDWHSSRDLARVWGVQNVTISPRWTLQIFSAVPVFGENESYIALLVEHNGDAVVQERGKWTHDFSTFVMFCSGPDGSHRTQVIARGNSWVCPWPREEWENKQFKVFLEGKNGTNLGMVLAEHDPKLLGHYKMMACVRDIFYVPCHKRGPRLKRPFSGPFKQWVEWMEWSSMHGLEHFLLYTFEGTDLAAVDLMKPYLDAGIASRVHFQFFHPVEMSRQGHFMNDCIYRAKNHVKWLTSVDVDEYIVFPGKVKYFNWEHILREEGVLENNVASLEIQRIRFARARPEAFEISSYHWQPTVPDCGEICLPKLVINVDNVYRTSIHMLKEFKAGTTTIKVNPKLAVLQHYRLPYVNVDYDKFDFHDLEANMTDATLQNDIPMLEAAIAARFNMKVPAVKGFLKNLAFRRPPDAYEAAATHTMQ